MSDACARWIELADREALGEALTTEEASFHAAHPASCSACNAEAGVWSAMESLVDAPEAPRRPEVPAQQRANVVREEPSTAELGPPLAAAAPRPSRRRRVVSGALATLAAAAAVLVVTRPWLPSTSVQPAPFVNLGSATASSTVAAMAPAPPVPPAPAADALVILASTSGGLVEVDGRAAVAGQPLPRGSVLFAREGSLCVTLEPGIRACAARGTLLRVADVGAHRRLELLGGKVAAELDRQRPGTSFGITTRDGSAVAIGTAFSVEVPPGAAPVVTRVLHGTVVVRSSSGSERSVTAHEKSSMVDLEVTPLPPAEEGVDRALLGASPPPLEEGRREPTASAPNVVASPSAADLLVAARERRARGDLDGARTAYRELQRRHGASAEAHAALVPSGELELASSAPSAALASFERYLVDGGALEQEASFGRIRALRALGRTAEERAAIASFVKRFPDGPVAASLADRLHALEGQAP